MRTANSDTRCQNQADSIQADSTLSNNVAHRADRDSAVLTRQQLDQANKGAREGPEHRVSCSTECFIRGADEIGVKCTISRDLEGQLNTFSKEAIACHHDRLAVNLHSGGPREVELWSRQNLGARRSANISKDDKTQAPSVSECYGGQGDFLMAFQPMTNRDPLKHSPVQG